MALSDDLAAHILTREFDLLRVASSMQGDALKALQSLESDIVDKINRGLAKTAFTKARLTALLEQTRGSIKKAYKDLARQNSEQMGQIAVAEAKNTADFVNAEISAHILSVATSDYHLQRVADKALVMGHPAKDWWAQQGTQTAQRFDAQMRLGFLAGESVNDLVKRVRGTKEAGYSDGIMAVSRRQAEGLVRTAVIAVANEARLQMYFDNSDVVKGIQWIATLDSRTTPICRGLDGLMWDLNLTPIGHDKAFPGPTAHFNCFTDDTPVSSPSKARLLYRRAYCGELITVETDNGRKITGTPNHPILTPAGWLPLGKVGISTNLVCQKDPGTCAARNPKDKSGKTTFGKLFKATTELSGMSAMQMPVAGPDFHGDGTANEIGQIWPYCALGDEVNAPVRQLLRESGFHRPDLDSHSGLSGKRHLNAGLSRMLFTANCIMRRVNAWLFTARPTGVQVFGATPGDASRLSPSAQSRDSDFKFPTNFARADLIGDIEIDRVCMISRSKPVSVFVHNLETEAGWYLADGIVSHNCRSTQISVLKSWDELRAEGSMKGPRGGSSNIEAEIDRQAQAEQWTAEQTDRRKGAARASMDGQVAGDVNYGDWLKKKPTEFQDEVLGPQRAKLFREGKASLQDMTSQNNRPLTVDQLKSSAVSTVNPVASKAVSSGSIDRDLVNRYLGTEGAAIAREGVDMPFYLKKASDLDLSAVAGAGAGDVVAFGNEKTGVIANVTGPYLEIQARRFYEAPNGEQVINNAYFMKKKGAPEGVGVASLAAQVKAARKLGFDKIEAFAAGGPDSKQYNGWYTWPRMGFDYDFGKTMIAKAAAAGFDATKVSDLMKTKEGQQWYRKNGAAAHVEFDLSDNSPSMKTFKAYLKEKGIKVDL